MNLYHIDNQGMYDDRSDWIVIADTPEEAIYMFRTQWKAILLDMREDEFDIRYEWEQPYSTPHTFSWSFISEVKKGVY